jgi:Tfp pilus assembly protein PilO
VERERRIRTDLQKQAATIDANGGDTRRFFKDMVGTREATYVPTLQEIEKMATAPGLKPGGRKYSADEVKGLPLQRVRIVLPLEGSYRQLVDFLRRVERSKRFLTVDRVQLHQGSKSEGDAGANLMVEMSAYFQDETGGESAH